MDEDLLLLKWNSHRSTFFHVLSNLRKKEIHTDATIACEGKFFPVHKLVLSTCSDYFSEVFERTSCKSPVVILKDMKHQEVETLLDYMYLGEVNVKQTDLASIIKAAECLQIKGLIMQDDELLNEANKRKLPGSDGSSPKRQKKDVNSNQTSAALNSIHFKSVPFPEIGDVAALAESCKERSHNDVNDDEERPMLIPVASMKVEEEENIEFNDNSASKDDRRIYEDNGKAKKTHSDTKNTDSNNAGPSGMQKDTSLWGDWSKVFPLLEGDTSQAQINADLLVHTLDADNSEVLSNIQQCPICNKTIKNLHNFQVHIRSHVERKLHICQYCPYSSMKVSDIQKHVRIHTGEKPYSCDYCPYKFSRSYHLKRHIQRIHSKEVSPIEVKTEIDLTKNVDHT